MMIMGVILGKNIVKIVICVKCVAVYELEAQPIVVVAALLSMLGVIRIIIIIIIIIVSGIIGTGIDVSIALE